MSATSIQSVNGSFLTIIALVLWFIAVIRSPKKGHTFLFVLACTIAGLVVGAAIGYFLGGINAASTLGALLMQFSAMASVNRMMLYRKRKTL